MKLHSSFYSTAQPYEPQTIEANSFIFIKKGDELNNENEAVEEHLLDRFLLVDLEHLGQEREQSSEHQTEVYVR
jgi:hypothetical protein